MPERWKIAALIMAAGTLLSGVATAEPDSATWKEVGGWVVSLQDNICVAKIAMIQNLHALRYNKMEFEFASGAHTDHFSMGSFGLYFEKSPKRPPDAIIYADESIVA